MIPAGSEPTEEKAKRWWRTPAAKWVATSVAGPVIAGVLLAVTTNFFGLSGGDTGKGSPASSPHPARKPALSQAVKAVQVAPYNDDLGTWVAERPIALSAADNARLSGEARADLVRYEQSMKHLGAVHAEVSDTRVILRGEWPEPVRITDLRPIVSCHPIVAGTYFYSPSAGAEGGVRLGLDLDDQRPSARTVNDAGQFGDPYFNTKTYTLKKDEEAVFNITAIAKKAACAYRLEFQLLVGERTTTQTVDDHGQPFRISGIAKDVHSYQKIYVGGVVVPNKRPGVQWCSVPPRTFGTATSVSC